MSAYPAVHLLPARRYEKWVSVSMGCLQIERKVLVGGSPFRPPFS